MRFLVRCSAASGWPRSSSRPASRTSRSRGARAADRGPQARATLVGAAVAEASDGCDPRRAPATARAHPLQHHRSCSPSTTDSAACSARPPTAAVPGPPLAPRPDAIRRNEPSPVSTTSRPADLGARGARAAGRSRRRRRRRPARRSISRPASGTCARTAVRMGVLMLLVTGITWALVSWSVTRPIARSRSGPNR